MVMWWWVKGSRWIVSGEGVVGIGMGGWTVVGVGVMND